MRRISRTISNSNLIAHKVNPLLVSLEETIKVRANYWAFKKWIHDPSSAIIYSTMEITQRTATLNDSATLLFWRNSLEAREVSVNTESISREDHSKWFSSRLTKVHFEPFLIFIAEQTPIGMTRLDLVSESLEKFEISIFVDPKYQGRGVGEKILKMTCDTFFSVNPEKTIVAKVHKLNFVSQKLFKKGGFEFSSQEEDFLRYEKNSI